MKVFKKLSDMVSSSLLFTATMGLAVAIFWQKVAEFSKKWLGDLCELENLFIEFLEFSQSGYDTVWRILIKYGAKLGIPKYGLRVLNDGAYLCHKKWFGTNFVTVSQRTLIYQLCMIFHKLKFGRNHYFRLNSKIFLRFLV